MSRRQERYARQATDCEDYDQNKCYYKLEVNLGFYAVTPNRVPTRYGFTTTMNKFLEIIRNTEQNVVMLKFNCITNNYLLNNIMWIFGEYADATVPARFARLINMILDNTNSRLTVINDGLITVNNIRLIDATKSTLEDIIHSFTQQFNNWKLRTGYEPAPQLLMQQ
jgi:hypothetical protein